MWFFVKSAKKEIRLPRKLHICEDGERKVVWYQMTLNSLHTHMYTNCLCMVQGYNINFSKNMIFPLTKYFRKYYLYYQTWYRKWEFPGDESLPRDEKLKPISTWLFLLNSMFCTFYRMDWIANCTNFLPISRILVFVFRLWEKQKWDGG